MQDRRKEDANLRLLHEENRKRLDILAANQEAIRTKQDAFQHSVEDLTARIEEHEQDADAVNKQLARINGAIFDGDGKNRLETVVDLITTLKMNGKAIAWIAIVVGGLGTAVGAALKHFTGP